MRRTQEQVVYEQETTSIWKNKQFMYLWTGSTISNLTFHILTLGLPLLIYEITTSSLAMGSMRAIEFLPNLLLAVFIGAIVDRYSKKKILSLSVLAQLIVVASLIFLLGFNMISLWVIYLLGFILYTALYANGSAYHTILPLIVTREQLTEANSALTLVRSVLNIAGPAIAGVILFWSSYAIGFTITFLGLIILLGFSLILKVPQNKLENKNTSFLQEIKEGLICLYENKNLWNLTILVLLSNIAASLTFAVFIFYSLDYLGLTERTIGIVLAATALGGAISALFAKFTKSRIGRGRTILYSMVLDFVSYLILFLSGSWLLISLGLFINGFSSGLINIHYMTLRQESTPSDLLGRVAGTSSMIMKLALPFSFLSAGLAAEFIYVPYLFLLSGFISLCLVFYLRKKQIINLR